jgi:hypothetical protein
VFVCLVGYLFIGPFAPDFEEIGGVPGNLMI